MAGLVFLRSFISRALTGGPAKTYILFNFPVVLFFIGLFALIPSEEWLDRHVSERMQLLSSRSHRAIAVVVLAMMITFGETMRDFEALEAAKQAGWHGGLAPNALVHNTCAVLDFHVMR